MTRRPNPQRGRQRAVLLFGGALATVVVALFALSSRPVLVEAWRLHRLDRLEVAAKQAAIEELGKTGGERAAARFIELFRDGMPELTIEDALADLYPRVRAVTRQRILEALIAPRKSTPASLVLAGEPRGLGRIAREHIDALPFLLESLTLPAAPSTTANSVSRYAATVAAAVAQHWAQNRAKLEPILRSSSPRTIAATLSSMQDEHSVQGKTARVVAGSLAASPPGDPTAVVPEIAAWLSEAHPDPGSRAAALSFRFVPEAQDEATEIALQGAFARDTSPLVKVAALRIAGILGPRRGRLDLARALLDERDPTLLAEAVLARHLWAEPPHWIEGFELFDGLVCRWLPLHRDFRGLPWEATELARLHELLASTDVPALRDACSLVLASRYSDPEAPRGPATVLPPRVTGLIVREWSVWRDGSATVPAAEPDTAAPAFLHRPGVARELSGGTVSQQLELAGAILTFRTPQPLSLLVRLGFQGGGPRRFFPAATDHAVGPSILAATTVAEMLGRSTVRRQAAAAPSPPPHASALVGLVRDEETHLRELTVSFQSGETAAVTGRSAPWLVPRAPQLTAAAVDSDERTLEPVGLEWRGLRVGHDQHLEGSEPVSDADHWWQRLREAGGDGVAWRGERERFLYQEGVVGLPAPVRVVWSDATGSELLLSARAATDYPIPRSAERWWLSDAEKDRLRWAAPLPAVLVVRVDAKGVSGAVLEDIEPGGAPLRLRLDALELHGEAVSRRLEEILAGEGLTALEARALVEIWRREFFVTPGLRVLTVVPRWLYEAAMPLDVLPVPEETRRVGVVWRECGDLEVGAQAIDALAEEDAWRERPWGNRRQPAAVERAAFEARPAWRLELGADGEVRNLPTPPLDIALSGDGSTLAVACRRWPVTGWDVHVLDVDRQELRLLERVEDVEPLVRPERLLLSGDGGHLALGYRSRQGWKASVIAWREGWRSPLRGVPAAISADGRKVLLAASHAEKDDRLAVLDLDKSEELVVLEGYETLSRWDLSSTLSGDGHKVAFCFAASTARSEVSVVDLERGTLVQASRGDGERPHLTHDGQRLLFESTRLRTRDLFLCDFSARRIANVTGTPGDERSLWLKADGRRLFLHDVATLTQVAVDLETGGRKLILAPGRIHRLEAAADGRRIAFLVGSDSEDLRLFVRRGEW